MYIVDKNLGDTCLNMLKIQKKRYGFQRKHRLEVYFKEYEEHENFKINC